MKYLTTSLTVPLLVYISSVFIGNAHAIRSEEDSLSVHGQAAAKKVKGFYPDRRLKKLEAFSLSHLLDNSESPLLKKIGLKGDAAKGIISRMNRRLAKSDGEVRITSDVVDYLGMRHVRLLQYYQGLPVVGSDMVVHVDPQNNIYAVAGNAAQPLSLSVTGKLGAKEAEDSATKFLNLDGKTPVTEPAMLVIFDDKLAYKLTLPGQEPDIWNCYVDANTGEVLAVFNRVLHSAPVGGAQAVVHGRTLADEGGIDQNINGWQDITSKYFLHNSLNKWGIFDEDAADWEQQATNDWATNDRAAVSLARNLELTQNYTQTVLHRNSFNNLGAFARATVHVGTNYVNAYWDGSTLNFGDGDGITANPLTIMDVVAHEYGHAITQYTSNLIYSGESGALNESYSDILGALVEFWSQPDGRSVYPSGTNGQADYLVGEDCWLDGEALRDMRNPQRFGQPSYYLGTNWYTGGGDNGGVHYNSGVQNFAFYLLSEGGSGSNDGHAYNITGLGIEHAGEIAMYANMYLLTSSATYRSAREAWILAASTLGYNTSTVGAVWAACGVLPLVSHLSATPLALNYGNVGVGIPVTMSITLSNDGASSTLVSGLTFSNPLFSTAKTTPFSVPSGGSVAVLIRYLPNALGVHSGSLTLTSNAADNPTLSISLSGVGTPPPVAELTPPTMALTLSPLDPAQQRMASLANTGSADLRFTTAIVGSTGWLSATPLTGTIVGGAALPITISINPASLTPGIKTAEVQISTNDPVHPLVKVVVTATISTCRNVTVTPAGLDFGNVFIGQSATRTLVLENRCNDITTVSGITVNNSLFTIGATTPLVLAPFSNSNVNVNFAPVIAGTISGVLNLVSNDEVNLSQNISLIAQSVLGPMITTTPAAGISAASTPGQTVTRTLTINNSGGMPLDWSITGAQVPLLPFIGFTEEPLEAWHFQDLAKGAEDTRVGHPVMSASGGPDQAGHRWRDSDAPGGPVYIWNDIQTTGTVLNTVSRCDDCFESKALSFAFPFYGTAYSTVFIGSNGILTFGAGSNQFANYSLPSSSAPANLIALFHDDLLPSAGGLIYFQDFGNRAIVQFQNVAPYNGSGAYTMQVELQNDGTITLYYKTLTGTTYSCTVGIQNGNASDGLNVVYNNAYLKNNLAVQLTTAPEWIHVSKNSGTLAAGGSEIVNVILNATNLALGTYNSDLTLSHNALNRTSPFTVPVFLEVRASQGRRSRVYAIGPAAQTKVSGSSFRIHNLNIGGEVRGISQGSRHRMVWK